MGSKWFTSSESNRLGHFKEMSVFDGSLSAEQAKVLCPEGTKPCFLLVNRTHYYSLTTGFVDSTGKVVKYVETAGRAKLVDVTLPIEPAPLRLIQKIYCACGQRATKVIADRRYCSQCVTSNMQGLKRHARKLDAEGSKFEDLRDEQSARDKKRTELGGTFGYKRRG